MFMLLGVESHRRLPPWGVKCLVTAPLPLHLAAEEAGMSIKTLEPITNAPAQLCVTPHKVERPASEEEVRETHAHHRHSLRRARCTSGGRRRVPRAEG